MSHYSENAAVRRIAQFDADEQLLDSVFGTVNGPGISSREGILFISDRRVGLSVTEGWFEGEAGWWIGQVAVVGVSWKALDFGNRQLCVETLDGRITVDFDGDQAHEVDPAERLRALVNSRVRADVQQHIAEVEAADQAGDFAAVLLATDAILARQPQCIPALYTRANACERLGRTDEAVDAYRMLIPAGATDPGEIHEGLARLLVVANRHAESIASATIAIDHFDRSLAYVWRALAHSGSGDPDAFKADLHHAIRTCPDERSVWMVYGDDAAERRDLANIRRAIGELQRLEVFGYAQRMRVLELKLSDQNAAAVDLGVELLTADPADSEVARHTLDAATCADPRLDALLPALDAAQGAEFWYQFNASCYLLMARRPDEAARRVEAAKARLSSGDSRHTVVSIFLAIAWGEMHVKNGQPGQAEGVTRPWEPRGIWPQEPWADDLHGGLCFVRGRALLGIGRAAEARRLLQMAEAVPRANAWWTAAELEGVLSVAYRTAGGDADGSLSAPQPKPDVYSVLGRLTERLAVAGRMVDLADAAKALLGAFDDPPLVAVMGHYSVGKSTFINALVGREILPSGEGVTTGAITWLRYGDDERIRIVFFDGTVREVDGLATVAAAVKETGGADDFIRKVHHVEIFIPAEILRRVRIVDSPGLNAPFPEHQKISEGYLTEADAVLYLFNVENAGRSDEAKFLAQLGEHKRKAVAVVNQIDLVRAEEAAEVIADIESTFSGCFATVKGVSGLLALRGTVANDPKLVERSRMPDLRDWLEEHLLTQARQVKNGATEAKLGELLREVASRQVIFAKKADETAASVDALRRSVSAWAGARLADETRAAVATIEGRLVVEVETLGAALVRETASDGTLDMATANTASRALVRGLDQAIDSAGDELLRSYDLQMESIQGTLASVDDADWRGAFSAVLMDLRHETRIWRKDLGNHLRIVRAFAAGFIDARGVWTSVLVDVPATQRRDVRMVVQALKIRTRPIAGQAEIELDRWVTEVRESLSQRLSLLERQLRTETSRILAEEFRETSQIAVSTPAAASPARVDSNAPRATSPAGPVDSSVALAGLSEVFAPKTSAAPVRSPEPDYGQAYADYLTARRTVGLTPDPSYEAVVTPIRARVAELLAGPGVSAVRVEIRVDGGKVRVICTPRR